MTEQAVVAGPTTRWAYFEEEESEGYLESQTVDPGGLSLTTTFETDARGNVTAVIDPRGVRHERSFNEVDWLVSQIQAASGSGDGAPPLSYTSDYLYDANGNLTELRRPYGIGGSQTTVERRTYGLLDEVREVGREVEPGGAEVVEVYTYDDNLNLRTQEAANGQLTEYTYDERNLLTGAVLGSGLSTSSFTYDDAGRQVEMTDGREKVWPVIYDGFSRVKEQADPLGNKTQTEYDANGNPIRVTGYQGELLLSETSSAYDLLNRPTQIDRELWSDTDPARSQVTTLMAYTVTDQLDSVTDPLERVTSFGYDAASRPVRTTDPMGNQVRTTLDPAGNVTEVATDELDSQGGGATTVIETYRRDALGRAVEAFDGMGNRSTYLYRRPPSGSPGYGSGRQPHRACLRRAGSAYPHRTPGGHHGSLRLRRKLPAPLLHRRPQQHDQLAV